MKKILEFNYPEDESEFVLHNSGPDMAIVLTDMDNYLRAKVKYEDLPEEKQMIYQEVRDKLIDLMNERGVSEIIWG